MRLEVWDIDEETDAKTLRDIKEQDVYMGDIPLMTENGTFIINGAERVVVSQLVRSPGAYFVLERDSTSDRQFCSAKLIPYRGAWLELETSSKNILSVKVDRKRKVSITTFLRALGYAEDDELLSLFADVDTNPSHKFIQSTGSSARCSRKKYRSDSCWARSSTGSGHRGSVPGIWAPHLRPNKSRCSDRS